MQEVIVMNPELSAGQKAGLFASFVIFCAIVWLIYIVGAPKR